MTIISKKLAESVGKENVKKMKDVAPDLFRGPEFTGSEQCLQLLMKARVQKKQS